jgi:mono/diheme cytochrome c family protein
MTALRTAVLAPWQRYSPVRRVFAALGIFLSIVLFICIALITIELIAARAINTSSSALNAVEKASPQQIERGAYLAKVGNCAACHTARGGAAFAGGLALHTPFGAVFTSNITPDVSTGIGHWNADAFYRAMHEGISADGKLLTPAFPYSNYTHVTRDDSDALYAYFMQGVQPVQQTNRAHDLPFPLNTQVALAVWRVMFFERGQTTVATEKIAGQAGFTWVNSPKDTKNTQTTERGAYLVRGLGHCSACHAQRNALGATINDQSLSGALMPMQDWYAPSLMDASQAGVMHWPQADVVALLKTGVAPNASVAGPMAEVVSKSTQYWTDADLQAAAAYLQSLPEVEPFNQGKPSQSPLLPRGEQLFAQHCATCHGADGQGLQVSGNVALPALAGNRAVTMPSTANLVRIVLAGGYAPSTAGNPRPFGMPPFVHVLNDDDIAAVISYIRFSWGNKAEPVSAADVVRHRKGLLQ